MNLKQYEKKVREEGRSISRENFKERREERDTSY